MRHYTPRACCYATRIYEIHLWVSFLVAGSYFIQNLLYSCFIQRMSCVKPTKVSFGFVCAKKFCAGRKKIETRSKKHDRNSPGYVIQWGLLAAYRTPVHVQGCFIIAQKLLLEASKTNTSFARLSASSSYVSLDLQQDNMHFASTLLQCFYHAN